MSARQEGSLAAISNKLILHATTRAPVILHRRSMILADAADARLALASSASRIAHDGGVTLPVLPLLLADATDATRGPAVLACELDQLFPPRWYICTY